jgi:hypothetical protein
MWKEKNKRFDEKVGMLHCFVGEQSQDIVLLVDRSDLRRARVWWVSMWNKKNKRFDEKVWMLHCFVWEQWQDVVLLHHRSHCRQGSVWWVSMWNKKNERFYEKVGMLHRFVVEQWQDVGLFYRRSHWFPVWVWWVCIWSGKKVSMNNDLRIHFINEFWNTRNCVFQLLRCILSGITWYTIFRKEMIQRGCWVGWDSTYISFKSHTFVEWYILYCIYILSDK